MRMPVLRDVVRDGCLCFLCLFCLKFHLSEINLICLILTLILFSHVLRCSPHSVLYPFYEFFQKENVDELHDHCR